MQQAKRDADIIHVNTPWEDWEDRYLIEHYGKVNCREIAELLCRTEGSVTSRACKLRAKGLIGKSALNRRNMYKPAYHWTVELVDWLADHMDTMTYDELAAKLGCDAHLVEVKAKEIRRNRNRAGATSLADSMERELMARGTPVIKERHIGETVRVRSVVLDTWTYGQVIYIHPERRHMTVQFKRRGNVIRESFIMREVRG